MPDFESLLSTGAMCAARTPAEIKQNGRRDLRRNYPGVAERLGGLLDDNLDPMIGGVLSEAAFLAARIRLKLKHEFSDANLIDQLSPHYPALTPLFVLVQAN